MISEIERNIITDELKDFRRGLKSHAEAIQAYIDIWAKDPQNYYDHQPEVGVEIYNLIILKLLGDPKVAENDEIIKRKHLFRAIIKRFYNKIK